MNPFDRLQFLPTAVGTGEVVAAAHRPEPTAVAADPPKVLRCTEHNPAMHMDRPGSEDLRRFKRLLAGCKARNSPFQIGHMLEVLLAALMILLFFNGAYAQPLAVPLQAPSGLLQDAKEPVSTNTGSYGFWPFSSDVNHGDEHLKSIPEGAPEFQVKLPEKSEGAIVSAVDFGLSESNEDCGEAINRALEHCRTTGASKLVLGKGTFRCFGPHGIVIDGLSNFTFDGRGARLVFRRKSDFSKRPQYAVVEENANVLIRNCTRVKVGNFAMDWDWETDPLGAFVRVIDKHVDEKDNNSYFDVEFINYDKYPFYPQKIPLLVACPVNESLDGFPLMGIQCTSVPRKDITERRANGYRPTSSESIQPSNRREYRFQMRTIIRMEQRRTGLESSILPLSEKHTELCITTTARMASTWIPTRT